MNKSKINLSSADKWIKKELNETVVFDTKFKFLLSHKGFRPGAMHILLGATGKGKSTLTRSILLELLEKHKVLLWLSEDSKEDFEIDVSYMDLSDELQKNIVFFSEQENNNDFELSVIEDLIIKEKPDIILFDNITTSCKFEDANYQDKQKFLKFVLNTCKKYNLPMFCVAHTGKHFKTDSLAFVSPNDVRGIDTTSNQAPYEYGFHKFVHEERILTFVSILKHRRHHKVGGEEYYAFEYDFEKRIYKADRTIPLKTINGFRKRIELEKRN